MWAKLEGSIILVLFIGFGIIEKKEVIYRFC